VFPNASVKKVSPGVTRNLVIKYEGQEVFNRQQGDGYLDE
jgi:hypothetical protein